MCLLRMNEFGFFGCDEFLVALRTKFMFPRQITMFGTDGESWSDGNVGNLESFKGAPHQSFARLGA